MQGHKSSNGIAGNCGLGIGIDVRGLPSKPSKGQLLNIHYLYLCNCSHADVKSDAFKV